jgi:hypothetical protein
MDGEAFCNEVRIGLAGLDLLAACEVTQGSGVEAISVEIEGITWAFLLEEVTRTQARAGAGLGLWGRSKTATLADAKYSFPVTKIWEENVLASALVAELAPGFSVDWDLEDWVIPGGVLSAENVLPMTVLQRIAQVQGGVVRSSPSGGLVFRRRRPTSPADLSEATPAITLTEMDDLLDLGDQRILAEGWNAVTVKGKSSAADEPAIQVELDEDRNVGRSAFAPGEEAYVRVYRTPFDLDYTHQVTLGGAAFLGTFVREISGEDAEEIQVSNGRAQTRYPVLSIVSMSWDGRELSSPQWDVGGREIRFTVAEGCAGAALLRLEYVTQYDLWRVAVSVEGTAILCLEDEEG